MFRSTSSRTPKGTEGFTLIEVLVALSVVAISLAAIGSLIAVTMRGARSVGGHLALTETARAIVTGLPDRDQLVPGNFSGEIAGHRWRVDVLPFYADFVDPQNDEMDPADGGGAGAVAGRTDPAGQYRAAAAEVEAE